MGNSVVAKPSSECPVICIEAAKLLQSVAGVPQGLLNVVCGDPPGVDPLVEHPAIKCLAFTGSTNVGAVLGCKAVRTMKRLQLELGGKNALVVCGDVGAPGAALDVEKAAEQACFGAFFHGGQICMASTKILVERQVADRFVEALVRRVKALQVGGDLRDPKAAYGPLISQLAYDKALKHATDAVAAGATLLCGGEAAPGPTKLTLLPTLLLDPPATCSAWAEETFGPLACVKVVEDLTEAICHANDSVYGLSAGVLTNDIQAGMRCVREIKAGSVHVGMHSFQSDCCAPIAGYGMSGLGKSGGHYSIEHFTEQKWCSIEVGNVANYIPPCFKEA